MHDAIDRPSVSIDWSDSPAGQLQALPKPLLAAARELMARFEPRPDPSLLPLAEIAHQRTGSRFRPETRAWSAVLGIDERELMLANLSYDLVLASFGCSTLAIATADGPVLARNMDWWPEDALARASVVLCHAAGGRTKFANAAWPGGVGAVTGWSARGFGAAMNAVSGLESSDLDARPTLLHLRQVLEDAADFADAVRMLAEERIVSSALFMVVGRENDQRVVIERTPSRHALRRPRGNEPLICTNDYRLLAAPQARAGNELLETSCYRFDALSAGCGRFRAAGPATDDELLSLLAGPTVAQGITAQHVIVRPRDESIRLLVPRRLAGPLKSQ